MLTIEIEFLHGTFRGSGDDLRIAGGDEAGEWPPSPARLFSALVAADGTRGRCAVTDGSELCFLERQPPPVIHADAEGDVPGSPVQQRFVVINATEANTVQNYPARVSRVARPGTRRSPRHPHVAFVWPDATADGVTLEGLRRRAARIGYLGCADSPVRVCVSDQQPGHAVPVATWEPDAAGRVGIPVPFEGLVDVLNRAFDDFTDRGAVRRSSYAFEHARYRSPDQASMPAVHQVPGTVVWLRFERALPGRFVLAVTSTLRKAILDHYQRLVPGAALPPVLTGHGFEGQHDYQHVHWLALPDVGHDRSRGRIHGAAVWLPEHTPSDVVVGVQKAVWNLRELVQPEVFSIGVRPGDGEGAWAARPSRWTTPARRFVSVFPVVHERFVRPAPDLATVAEWCEHAGLPAPVAFREHRSPILPGSVLLKPQEVFRNGDARKPYRYMEMVFDRPVAGPVVVGGKRQFGLGLFAPMPDKEDRDG